MRLTISSRRRAVSSALNDSSAVGGLLVMPGDSSDGFLPDDSLWAEANLALGRYLSAWGDVENVVGFLFQDLAVPDKRIGSIILSHMTTRDQLKALGEIVEVTLPGQFGEDLIKLLRKTEAAAGERNKIVHGTWSLLTPPPVLYRVSQTVTEHKTEELLWGIKGHPQKQGYKARNAFSIPEISRNVSKLKNLQALLVAARADLGRLP